MLTAIRGIYHDGIVDLDEAPSGVSRARVVVMFLESEGRAPETTGAIVSLGNRFRSPTSETTSTGTDPVADVLAELRQERARRLLGQG